MPGLNIHTLLYSIQTKSKLTHTHTHAHTVTHTHTDRVTHQTSAKSLPSLPSSSSRCVFYVYRGIKEQERERERERETETFSQKLSAKLFIKHSKLNLQKKVSRMDYFARLLCGSHNNTRRRRRRRLGPGCR